MRRIRTILSLFLILVFMCAVGTAEEKYAKPGEKLLLFEQDGVKLYLTGEHEETSAFLQLKAIVENNTDRILNLSYTGTANGWTIGNMGLGNLSGGIQPNSKAKTYLWFQYEECDFENFTGFQEMDLIFTAKDDSYNELFKVNTGKIYFDAGMDAAGESAEAAAEMSFSEILTSEKWIGTHGSIMSFYVTGSGNTDGVESDVSFLWEDIGNNAVRTKYTLPVIGDVVSDFILEEVDGIYHLSYVGNDVYYVRESDAEALNGVAAPAGSQAAVLADMISDITEEDTDDGISMTPAEQLRVSLKDYETLQVGSKGDAVKELQAKLIEGGYLTGSADGIFGKGTAGGVKSFQESVGIEASGIADEATQRRLYGDGEAADLKITLSGVTETQHMRLNGLFVDESYVNKDNENITLLYMFYDVFTDNENLKVDSKGSTLKINDQNSYESAHHVGAGRYMSNYYYSSYIENVYVGSTLKLLETFSIPKGDLAAGRKMAFKNNDTGEQFTLSTNDIVFCSDAKTIAKIADPEGYADQVYKLSDADDATCKKVKNAINGYTWDFYVNNIWYKISFSGNSYTLKTAFGTTGGSYVIKNGYVVVTNKDTGAVNYIPYSWGANDIDLDVVNGFDVSEN